MLNTGPSRPLSSCAKGVWAIYDNLILTILHTVKIGGFRVVVEPLMAINRPKNMKNAQNAHSGPRGKSKMTFFGVFDPRIGFPTPKNGI